MPMPKLFLPQHPAAVNVLTVRVLVSTYLQHCAAEGRHCLEARREREYVLGLFVDEFGDFAVCDLKAYHLRDFVAAHPRWRCANTRRVKSNCVRAVFQWAADDERIDRNPFRAVRYGYSERRPEMPDDVLEHIIRVGHPAFGLALRFLRLTGCRISEMCRATWDDVDLIRGAWVIPEHKSRKRTGKAKVVALIPEAVTLLRAMSVQPTLFPEPAKPIFLNSEGGKPWNRDSLDQHFRRVKRRERIECRASLNGIRHTFAGRAIANGAPIKLIAAQLGHASVATTERYYVDLSGEIDAIREAARRAIRAV